jgi:tetratricopeptide (TPR) repeat protein
MGVTTAGELLRLGREALGVADWERARAVFEQAAAFGESAEVLDGLGEAMQFGGDHARAIELKQRAFTEYERRGLRAEAAGLARWLAFLHVSVHGNVAAANGWMARAESLLEGVEECAAHGWLMLDRAPWTSDAAERERLATAAIAIARRYGDRDLEFDAMALLGEAHVAAGRLTEGMTLLDQAMAAVASGEVVGVGPVGEIYCRLLSACERATDVRRAEQWLAAATRFAAWGDFVPPTCRTHYGGIDRTRRWEEAERELLAAIRTFETGYWASQLFALLRLADLRVRQGRFEEAERLLEGIDWHAGAKRSLARIALARGDLALAGDLSRLCRFYVKKVMVMAVFFVRGGAVGGVARRGGRGSA